MTRKLPFIAYPSVADHAVTGDRRTAALVAADGTIDWMCLPDYDGMSVFGALIDAQHGGYWHLGLPVPTTGQQRYLQDSPAVVTHWTNGEWELEVTDLMAWPQRERPKENENRRVIIRRIQCLLGRVTCAMDLRPRADFKSPATVKESDKGLSFHVGEQTLGLWTTFPVTHDDESVHAEVHLRKNDEHWAVLALGEPPEAWNKKAVEHVFFETDAYWRDWLDHLNYRGPHARNIERSGLIIHLLGYAPTGSVVAAPTTSLPERIGGDRNYDYRFAWIRDASLSIGGLSLLGDLETSNMYLDWLAHLNSTTQMPLQVAYHISGRERLKQHERRELAGYRGSKPVRMGNRAYDQIQHGAFGYLADCALIHLERGGKWKEDHWRMIERIADYIIEHWQEPDSGIWELAQPEQFVASKVMCWVVLDRAIEIARRTGKQKHIERWRQTRERIHAEVALCGWSDEQQTFVQRYGSDALDAAVLLMPVMGFLPADHPRVQSTIERLVESLSVNGFLYRFQPLETPGNEKIPMEQFEGAFLPVNFWLATAYAKSGRIEDAEHLLERIERLTNASGLYAEEADARSGEMIGNFPLLFSQVEYVRAVLAISAANEKIRPARHTGYPHTNHHRMRE